MSAATLLSYLDGVKRTGPSKWIARCPAHDDKSPSLCVSELADGRVLVHDFAGCGTQKILETVGLTFEDLFPPRPIANHVPRERRAFLPSDVFEIARLEIAVVAVIAADMHQSHEVNEEDYKRLSTAAERLDDIARTAYGSQ